MNLQVQDKSSSTVTATTTAASQSQSIYSLDSYQTLMGQSGQIGDQKRTICVCKLFKEWLTQFRSSQTVDLGDDAPPDVEIEDKPVEKRSIDNDDKSKKYKK
jgi:hypothetical protein